MTVKHYLISEGYLYLVSAEKIGFCPVKFTTIQKPILEHLPKLDNFLGHVDVART